MVIELQQKIKSAFNNSDLDQKNIAELAILKNYKLFPRNLLVKAPWNFKTEDETKSKKLLESVKRNGQIVSCQVRKLKTGYYEVVDGNHRKDVFDKLKQEYVLAYDHGEISESEAKLLAFQMKTEFEIEQSKAKEAMNSIIEDLGSGILEQTVDLVEFGNLIDTGTSPIEDIPAEPDTTERQEDKTEIQEQETHTEEKFEETDLPTQEQAQVDEPALPGVILRYELIFENDEQQENWYKFLKHLKDNGKGETIAERIHNYLNENLWTQEK